MTRMGLVYDANRAIKSRSIKEKMVANLKRIKDDDEGEDEEEPHAQVEESEVVRKLRADVASYEKKNNFRLPAEDVRWVTEMMDKHGDDFKVRDYEHILIFITDSAVAGKKFFSFEPLYLISNSNVQPLI
jgi:predicted DNA binding CopG/RHH family protein